MTFEPHPSGPLNSLRQLLKSRRPTTIGAKTSGLFEVHPVLSYTRTWVDADSRGSYASAMRAPTHSKPLEDLNQTPRSYLQTLGRSATAAHEGPLLKSALATDLRRHRSRQPYGRRSRIGRAGRRRSAGSEQPVRRFVASRRHPCLLLMFSALFHQSSHSGFGPIGFWTCFPSGAVHTHPEMVFVSTYFIYRRWLNG
jgi:hypothetical protein